MKRAFLAVAAVSLSACASEGEQAEQQYEWLRSNAASSAELCNAGRAVEQAYANEQNPAKYREWKQKASALCSYAGV